MIAIKFLRHGAKEEKNSDAKCETNTALGRSGTVRAYDCVGTVDTTLHYTAYAPTLCCAVA